MDIMTTEHPTASEYSKRVASYYTPNQPFILATEVLAEVEKRCGSGQQYTTFPNQISDAEKAKVEQKGYKVTRNTINGENRDGAEDIYIGFQVALNATAAAGDRPMQISQKETNGIESGSSSGGDDGNGGGDNDGTLDGITLLAVPDSEGG